ncbi:hypothetical protein QJQ45_000973 [Haematococcus lacustris]|nr:hypothetical protein QJQ45_000973 [Haematococcus lacustris]
MARVPYSHELYALARHIVFRCDKEHKAVVECKKKHDWPEDCKPESEAPVSHAGERGKMEVGRYNRLSDYWKVPRDYKTFYPNIFNVAGWDGEQAFKKNFHLPRAVYNLVYREVSDHPLLRRNCLRKDFLTQHEQLAIALNYMAHGGSFTQVGNALGCSTTSVCRCVVNVATAIWERLSHVIAMPANEAEWQANVLGFHELSGLVQVVGAIDGTYLRIELPDNGGDAYYCHKKFHAIQAQGLVNHLGKLMDLTVGHAGRAHDASVFADSSLECCKGMSTQIHTSDKVFMACCILMNLCIDDGEQVPPVVVEEAWRDYELRLAEDEAGMEQVDVDEVHGRRPELVRGASIRDALVLRGRRALALALETGSEAASLSRAGTFAFTSACIFVVGDRRMIMVAIAQVEEEEQDEAR